MVTKIEELKLDVEELTNLMKITKRPKVSSILSLEIRKLETEIIRLNELVQQTDIKNRPASTGAVATPNPASTVQKCYDVKITTYAWDQSDKFVKIFVTLKNVHTLEKEQINCSFEINSMELTVKELEYRNYFLHIKGLLYEIDASKSSWKVKNNIVVVLLAKKTLNQKWSHLSSTEQKAKEPKMKEQSDDTTADVMSIMKDMFESGDDEMKRTIAKVWTESRDKQNVMV